MRSVLDVTEDTFEAEVLKVDNFSHDIASVCIQGTGCVASMASLQCCDSSVTMQADVPVLIDFWATW